MTGNPREHGKDKGFWDGGAPGNAKDSDTSGRVSGFPGRRTPTRIGIRTDLEFPPEEKKSEPR